MSDLRSTVFVGNLSVFVSEQDVERLFSTYGTILEIRMAKSEDRSKHLSYGFVKFTNVASAQLAMHELNGSLLCGRPLKVGKALSRSNKCSSGSLPNSSQSYGTASVHVTFISHQINRIVSEESLRHLFSQFGEVMDAVISKSNIDQDVGRQSGYGFIHYSGSSKGIESSFQAAETLMDIMIDEINYKCKISHHLERQLLEVSGDLSTQPSPYHQPSSVHAGTSASSRGVSLPMYPSSAFEMRQSVYDSVCIPNHTMPLSHNPNTGGISMSHLQHNTPKSYHTDGNYNYFVSNSTNTPTSHPLSGQYSTITRNHSYYVPQNHIFHKNINYNALAFRPSNQPQTMNTTQNIFQPSSLQSLGVSDTKNISVPSNPRGLNSIAVQCPSDGHAGCYNADWTFSDNNADSN